MFYFIFGRRSGQGHIHQGQIFIIIIIFSLSNVWGLDPIALFVSCRFQTLKIPHLKHVLWKLLSKALTCSTAYTGLSHLGHFWADTLKRLLDGLFVCGSTKPVNFGWTALLTWPVCCGWADLLLMKSFDFVELSLLHSGKSTLK